MAHVNGKHYRIIRVSPIGEVRVVLKGSRKALEWQLEKLVELHEITKGMDGYRYCITSIERLNELGIQYTKHYN